MRQRPFSSCLMVFHFVDAFDVDHGRRVDIAHAQAHQKIGATGKDTGVRIGGEQGHGLVNAVRGFKSHLTVFPQFAWGGAMRRTGGECGESRAMATPGSDR